MTPSSSAQDPRNLIPLRAGKTTRTLAQRRADFEAQMRDMALSDLSEVAARLKALHARLERQDAREWPQQEVAEKAGVKYRTYQAWVGAKNENQDGTGYEALARFYRRRLGDKAITKEWIIFGDASEESADGTAPAKLAGPRADQLDRIERVVEEILKRLSDDESGKEAVPDRLNDEPDPSQDVPDEDEPETPEGEQKRPA